MNAKAKVTRKRISEETKNQIILHKESKGGTHAEIAEHFGISTPTVSKILSGGGASGGNGRKGKGKDGLAAAIEAVESIGGVAKAKTLIGGESVKAAIRLLDAAGSHAKAEALLDRLSKLK